MTLSNSTSMADQSVPDIAPTAVTELQSVMSASVEEKAGAREADGERNAGTNAKNTKKDEAEYSVPFFKLFAYADLVDVLLMIIGTIGSVANGVALPLMTLIFGSLTNAFGNNQHDTSVLVHQVSKVCVCPPSIIHSS
jgi:ATP-binding cassette subfamily B (MDR/TAP) protein 1